VRRALLSLATAAVAASCVGGHDPAGAAGGSSPLQYVVLRADQAPIVGLPDVLAADTLLGHRIRVLGWCAEAPGILAGRRIGAWTLATPDTSIEVRGLVPSVCAPRLVRQAMVLVFAQVVAARPDSSARLLLRLPE
jgi:hypothetical protein